LLHVFKKCWCLFPEKKRDNSAETCSSYVKDRTNKLQDIAFAGFT